MSRFLITLFCVAVLSGGCALLPTAPRPEADQASAKKRSRTGEPLEIARAPGDATFFTPRSASASPDRWVLRSEHLAFGVPKIIDDRYNLPPDETGLIPPPVTVLVKPGCVIGHGDKLKSPLWVAQRIDAETLKEGTKRAATRDFAADPELPEYARAAPDYDTAKSGYERATMAVAAGALMSGVAPLRRGLFDGPWKALLDAERDAFSGADGTSEMWVISGPIFDHGRPRDTIGNDIGVSEGFFKVFLWMGRDGRLHMRGLVAEQRMTSTDLAQYLRPVDEIERRTGIDFFPDMPSGIAAPLESAKTANLWKD